MRATLILLKIQQVRGGDGVHRFALSWTLRGSPEPGVDGGVCCDDLEEALRHVALAIEEDQRDQTPICPRPAPPEDVA